MPHGSMPDFLIIGAPKAGTTALHAALAQHPEVFVSNPKEPKYWLCDDAPPPAWNGPGDKHSQQEWIWRRGRVRARSSRAPVPGQVRGESTPFYLWSRGAHRRIAENLPDVRLIAVVRDPIDRAYSNWMHLWSDGLEPVSDFERTFALQQERIDAGLGAVLAVRRPRPVRRAARAPLPVRRPRSGCSSCATAPSSTIPRAAVDRACRFLGITPGPDRLDPARQLPRLRGAGLAATAARAGRPHRRAARASSRRRRSGARRACRSWPSSRGPARATGRTWRRRPGSGCSRTSPRTSGCSASSPARTSATGCRPPAAARSCSAVRLRPASARQPGRAVRAGSPNQRDQVVRAVGARGLDVEPGPPVGQRHRGGVAPGAVGVRRRDRVDARRRPGGCRPSARRRWSRTSSTPRRRGRRRAPSAAPAVSSVVTRAPRASQLPGRPASTSPRSTQSSPLLLTSSRVVIRSSWPTSSSGWQHSHIRQPFGAERDDRVLHGGALVAGVDDAAARPAAAPRASRRSGCRATSAWSRASRRRGTAASRCRGSAPAPVARTTRCRTPRGCTSATGSNSTPSSERATTTLTPRPEVSGRRTR